MSPTDKWDPWHHSFQPCRAVSGASVQIAMSTYHSDLPVKNSSFSLEVGMKMLQHPD